MATLARQGNFKVGGDAAPPNSVDKEALPDSTRTARYTLLLGVWNRPRCQRIPGLPVPLRNVPLELDREVPSQDLRDGALGLYGLHSLFVMWLPRPRPQRS